MDVTTEVNKSLISMGGSGTTYSPHLASAKTLNYAADKSSINNAAVETITAIPHTVKYSDTVGLFGTENVFIKLQLNILSSSSAFANVETPENDYISVWTFIEDATINRKHLKTPPRKNALEPAPRITLPMMRENLKFVRNQCS